MSGIEIPNKELHRARMVEVERFKAGVVPSVITECGKVLVPSFPRHMRKLPRCPICFPATDRHKFAIVA